MRGKGGKGRVFIFNEKKGGKIWHVAFYAPGPDGRAKEIRESSHSEKKADAEELLALRLRAVANDRDGIQKFKPPKMDRVTVDDLLDSLEANYRLREIKSLGRTLNHAKPVREFFGHRRALSVTADLIRSYIEMRKADGRSNAKVNRETEILSAAFNLALKDKKILSGPHVTHLKENNGRKGFFERDEHERMLACLESPMDNVARFAYVCGWRKEEIRTLRWENVDRAAREVRIYDSKNSEGRTLPLDGETWSLFERLWSSRQYKTPNGPALSEFVFHCGNGKPVGEANFEIMWRRARTKAGLPSKLFHDYRRTSARNMIRAGVAQTVAMSITGHKTDSMFRRYNITSAQDKRDALQRQVDYLKAQPTTNVTPIRKPNTEENTEGASWVH